ncbi:uncharacterized protein LOC141718593 [Apium graveolens]|uniref:uncharacterized protein LOC141718593 n=1 Tax=Apium graveolens TaxID=4045 RepID=UPI003D7A25A7
MTSISQLMNLLKIAQSSDSTIGTANFAGITSQRKTSFIYFSDAQSTSWILDSGASDHMCSQKELFTALSVLPHPIHISLPHGEIITISHAGTVPLTHDIVLTDGHSLRKPLELGSSQRGLYLFHSPPDTKKCSSTNVFSFSHFNCNKDIVSALIWHHRLGHLPLSKLQTICHIDSRDAKLISACDVCAKARQHRLPFPKSSIHTIAKFELLHIDLGFKGTVKIVRTALELGLSKTASDFLLSNGIIHQTSCSHTPQQNGVVERYPYGKKAYKFLDLENNYVLISRDVVFHESIFPYTSHKTGNFIPLHILDFQDESTYYHDVPVPIVHTPSSSNDFSYSDTNNGSSHDNPPQVRKSTRSSKVPNYLNDYVHSYAKTASSCHNTTCFCTITSMCTPIFPSVSSVQSSCFSANIISYISPPTEPSSYKEAIKYPEWQKAISAEIAALEANRTWSLVKLPPGKKPISCKWVFKVKQNSDGTIERYKARLVVRGFTQVEGVDFTETFSPVVKMTTIRALVATAVKKGWNLFLLDVNNVFLHGDLYEDACFLLQTTLLSRGYTVSQNDSSLFYKRNGSLVVYLAVYVDDILVVGNYDDEIVDIKAYLDSVFKIKDLDKLRYFLGMEFTEVPDGMIISQRKFTMDLLSDFDCSTSSPVVTPLDLSIKLLPDQGALLTDASEYRRLIGKLNFLTNTRPDLSFCVQHLSQFMSSPRQPHWDAAIHVLKYLRNDPGQGLLYTKNSSLTLEAYCDADWASCPNSRRSVSGFVILLGGNLIFWKSKQQHTVSLSSAEAEYRSLRRLTTELAWLSRLLYELDAAIYIAKNPVYHERTKHIELDCHFVRTKLASGLISLSYTPSKEQFADICTKPLTGLHHHGLLGIGLVIRNFRGMIVRMVAGTLGIRARRQNELYTFLEGMKRAFLEDRFDVILESDHENAYWEWRNAKTHAETWDTRVAIVETFGRVFELWCNDTGLGPIGEQYMDVHELDILAKVDDEVIDLQGDDGVLAQEMM